MEAIVEVEVMFDGSGFYELKPRGCVAAVRHAMFLGTADDITTVSKHGAQLHFPAQNYIVEVEHLFGKLGR